MEATTATDAERKSLVDTFADLRNANVGGLGKVLELAGSHLEDSGAEVARNERPHLLARLGSDSPAVLLAARLSSASSGSARDVVPRTDPQQALRVPAPAANLAVAAVLLEVARGLTGRYPNLGMELVMLGDGRCPPKKSPDRTNTNSPSCGFLLDVGGSMGEVMVGSLTSFRVRGRFLSEGREVAEDGEEERLAAVCAMESIEAMWVERSEGEEDFGLDLVQRRKGSSPPDSDFNFQADAWGGDVDTAAEGAVRIVEGVAWAVGSAEADAVLTISRDCRREVADAGSLPARIVQAALGAREMVGRFIASSDPRFTEDLGSLGCPAVGVGSGPAAALTTGGKDASQIELLLEVTYALLERFVEELKC